MESNVKMAFYYFVVCPSDRFFRALTPLNSARDIKDNLCVENSDVPFVKEGVLNL